MQKRKRKCNSKCEFRKNARHEATNNHIIFCLTKHFIFRGNFSNELWISFTKSTQMFFFTNFVQKIRQAKLQKSTWAASGPTSCMCQGDKSQPSPRVGPTVQRQRAAHVSPGRPLAPSSGTDIGRNGSNGSSPPHATNNHATQAQPKQVQSYAAPHLQRRFHPIRWRSTTPSNTYDFSLPNQPKPRPKPKQKAAASIRSGSQKHKRKKFPNPIPEIPSNLIF